MDVIILAGGFGRRLAHVVSDVPKPMAPVCGKPFLFHLLRHIARYKVDTIILATGYKSESISGYFKQEFMGIPIKYSVEKEPLGTGGAIKLATTKCTSRDVIVINGDTYCPVNLSRLSMYHRKKMSDLTIVVKTMYNFDRYGTVQSDDEQRIVSFSEKKYTVSGDINTGIYIMKSDLLADIIETRFSFEQLLSSFVDERACYVYNTDVYFIDIGIPVDYARINNELSSVL